MSRNPVFRAASTASPRPSPPKRTAPSPSGRWVYLGLLLFALLLARVALTPVHAQSGHVHQWQAGNGPLLGWGLAHLDGSPVTDDNPARQCETLRITFNSSRMDTDQCAAPACPWPDALGEDPYLTILRWRDHGALGSFVREYESGHFDNNEFQDPQDGKWYGFGDSIYYHVDQNQPVGSVVTVQPLVDDTDAVYGNTVWRMDQPETSTGFDDTPIWGQTHSFVVAPAIGSCIATYRTAGKDELGVCKAASAQPGASTITPLDGDVSFRVPIASWGYRGIRISFSLTYHSQSVIDPALSFKQPRHPAALSDDNVFSYYNPKWTHTFSQWIEVVSGGWAVWHRGDGTQMAFEQWWDTTTNPPSGPFWRSEDSFHTLTSSGKIESPEIVHEGDTTTVTAPYGTFVIRDGEGTAYTFDHVIWHTADHPRFPQSYAIPYFLLTRVQDRWGRVISINWSADGVTSVVDGAARGLSFTYSGGLISAISDPYGRTHTLSYTAYSTPDGRTQRKPTGVTVQGIGSPNRTSYTWSFSYGGAFNDLIVQKQEPGGRVVYYEYEPVNVPRQYASDWDGRLTRCYWTDHDGVQPLLREIQRNGTTLTYPGGDSYGFTYVDEHLTEVHHTSTGASIVFDYDQYHNLTSFRTGIEPVWSPLVSVSYTYGGTSGQQITSATATDILGNSATVWFNALNLPTELRVRAAPGSGRADQVTRFVYDNGGPPTYGNLTRLVEALGTPSEDWVDFEYASSAFPSLPTAVLDSVGGRASVSGFHLDGTPTAVSSPPNLLAPAGDPDRNPSTVRIEQNLEELPSAIVDPMGHRTEIGYCAESPGSSRLVITFRNVADNSTRSVTLDAEGKPLCWADENGVRTEVEYNPSGQPLRITTAAGTRSARMVRYYYSAQMDLAAFDPPAGSAGRVYFEYHRYVTWYPGYPPQRANPEVYEGQVTRIRYPDGTSEYFGYNGAEELVWHVRADGTRVNLSRDALHRVYRVDYPQTLRYPAFAVEAQFDEFSRLTQLTDGNGTSTYVWDDLGRLIQMAPAVGRGVSYAYQRDPTNARWITEVTVAGIGTWQFGEDGKGRLAEVLNPFQQYARTFFDPDGKTVRETRPNGTSSLYFYTARDWLSGIEHRLQDGTLLDRFDYLYTDSNGVYDPTGRLRREVDSGGRVHEFFYNALSELVAETHPDFGTITYTLDANGNRTSWTAGGVTTWAGYDAQNKLLWTNQAGNVAPTPNQPQPYRIYTYNANGEPTELEHRDPGQGVLRDRYDWDGMGKLRRILCVGTLQERYTADYDGFGTRVRSSWNGLASTYSFGAGLLHTDRSAGGNVTYTPGVGQRLGSTDAFLHTDWLGSTRYLTAGDGRTVSSAYRYDAFGNLTAFAGTDGTVLKWAGAWGYQADVPMGLLQVGERQYDPAIGRWLSPDPIGFAAGLNLYAYCDGNPVNNADPSGLYIFLREIYSRPEIQQRFPGYTP